MAEGFENEIGSPSPAEAELLASGSPWSIGPLWFTERALTHARTVYLVQELEAGAGLWGAQFVTGILNTNLRAVGRHPLALTRLPDSRVVVYCSGELETDRATSRDRDRPAAPGGSQLRRLG